MVLGTRMVRWESLEILLLVDLIFRFSEQVSTRDRGQTSIHGSNRKRDPVVEFIEPYVVLLQQRFIEARFQQPSRAFSVGSQHVLGQEVDLFGIPPRWSISLAD